MADYRAAVGQIKRDISQLLERVAGGERVVITSHGKPLAAIVSLADYERLQQAETAARRSQWESWLAANERLTARILAEREGAPVDVEAIWTAARTELIDHR
ncbi:MAG: type II toxin-antitoxin system Phd/YefM family antitoxin [Anaerolineales bacterium]|nr:type II toxin-antitoxin system Phd/YefM family antitoxin [Anaerolineales bacterium]